jgi:hypothetical protein
VDSERALKIEMSRALDEVLPPAPWLEAAVREDLYKRRSSRSRRRDQGKPGLVWPRSAMQLAAAVLIVVLAAAALAAFLDLRYRATNVSPAAMDVPGYQSLVSRDLDRLVSAGNGIDCTTLQSTCPAPGKPVFTAYQRLSNDLDASKPPARFAVIDAQLRRHLAAAMADLNGVFAAYAAKDQVALDRDNYLLDAQGEWVRVITRSIAQSKQGTVSTYIESIRAAKQGLTACDSCRIGSGECTEIQTVLCEADVVYAKIDIESLEAALVGVAAPTSLAAQDELLQRDLVHADVDVLSMATAQLTGDQTGFNASLHLLEQALPAVDADLAAIPGG